MVVVTAPQSTKATGRPVKIRTALAAAVAVALTTGPLASLAHGQSDLDCSNFAFQEDAQSEFNRDPSDPHRLDEDQGSDDGIACEVLPHRSAIGTMATAIPTRGVQGGIGGSAGPADFEQAVGGVLACGALVLATVYAARRRRGSGLGRS